MKNIFISLIFGALCSFTTQATEAPCFRYEANIPLSSLDYRLGFSGNDIIRDFNNASQSAVVKWEDGTVTTSHWEFTPASDAAEINIVDYDDDCSGRAAWLGIEGVLTLKTGDGRIDARWNTNLSRIWGVLNSGLINLIIEPQGLQGLPERLEGEHEWTYISISAEEGQLNGAIFRSYVSSSDIIENGDGSIEFPPHYNRGLAFIGNGLDIPAIIWDKPNSF